jgi:S-adenosyl-L-methionine hydrolase (adenosine-forming)
MNTTPIAILTDFGTTDIYVGVMKGVMLNISPATPLVDITHAVRPQDVRQGAFLLMNSYRYFPTGTIFLCVVDPGVGSARQPIAVEAGGYRFVAPDNGLLSWALMELGDVRAVALTNLTYRLPNISSSFHGRDIFAPAAAYLAKNTPLEAFGVTMEALVTLPAPALHVNGRQIEGEVLDVDHFGNIVTSIGYLIWKSPEALILQPRFGNIGATLRPNEVTVVVGGVRLPAIQRTYSETVRGDLLAMVGSSGFLEIAVNQGSAAARLNVSPGDVVFVEMG